MDEETPHLHIDFVPFVAGSKRGMDTRVSLKQALTAQGFMGGTRRETEWNQWIESEKQEFSNVMARYGVIWKQLGTHNKHLSVLDFEKQERSKEVQQLEIRLSEIGQELQDVSVLSEEKKATLQSVEEEIIEAKQVLKNLGNQKKNIERNVRVYDENLEWQLPEPAPLMSAKTYRDKKVEPLVQRLKEMLKAVTIRYINSLGMVKDLQQQIEYYKKDNQSLKSSVGEMMKEKGVLSVEKADFEWLKRALGVEKVKSHH